MLSSSTGGSSFKSQKDSKALQGRDLQAEALARSDVVGALLAKRDHLGKRLTTREKLFLLLADPTSGRWAKVFGVFMWAVVLLSSFSYVYETMRSVTDRSGPYPWLVAKMAFQIFYTAEALIRAATFIPVWKGLTDFFVLLDLVSDRRLARSARRKGRAANRARNSALCSNCKHALTYTKLHGHLSTVRRSP